MGYKGEYMEYSYRIYVNGYKGYEIKDVVYDLESVQEIIDELDPTKYFEYLVIEHNIKENSDNPIAHGYLDYNVKRLKK